MIGTCRKRSTPSPTSLPLAARGRRRRVLLLASLALAFCLLAPPTTAASSAAEEGRNGYAAGDGRDAFGLRLGLLCFVGMVLAGGAYVQYQSLTTLRRGRPATSRRRRVAAPTAIVRGNLRPVPRASGPDAARTAERPTAPAWPRQSASPQPLQPVAQRAPAPQPLRVAAPRDLAEQDCLRAIAAACRYDRHTTLAAFRSALARNPEVPTSSLPGFWDMPSGGHADLARAYLLCGQHLDARSILTVAMMLSPHNRELEALAREGNPPTRPAFPLRSQG